MLLSPSLHPITHTETRQVTIITNYLIGFYMTHINTKIMKPNGFINRS